MCLLRECAVYRDIHRDDYKSLISPFISTVSIFDWPGDILEKSFCIHMVFKACKSQVEC